MQKSGQAQVIVEPVERWQHVIGGEQGNLIVRPDPPRSSVFLKFGLLSCFSFATAQGGQDRMYKDPQRWAYLFQSYVLLTMMEAHDTPQAGSRF
jgi:hypothetical protein